MIEGIIDFIIKVIPLFIGTMAGLIAIVDRIIKWKNNMRLKRYGIDLKRKKEIFFIRLRYGDREIDLIKCFLKSGLNPNTTYNEEGVPALIIAIKYRQVKTVECLLHYRTLILRRRTNVNIKSVSGTTPLEAAILVRREDIAKLLIERGASEEDAKGAHLIVAVYDGNSKKVSQLLREEADLEARTLDGDTPLMIAARIGHLNILKKLIENGADVNATNSKYQTPLILAASFGQCKIVEALLNQGRVNDNAEDRDGRTASDIARAANYPEIESLLMDRSGTSNGAVKTGRMADMVSKGG
jgi:ankyrin repeat protein